MTKRKAKEVKGATTIRRAIARVLTMAGNDLNYGTRTRKRGDDTALAIVTKWFTLTQPKRKAER